MLYALFHRNYNQKQQLYASYQYSLNTVYNMVLNLASVPFGKSPTITARFLGELCQQPIPIYIDPVAAWIFTVDIVQSKLFLRHLFVRRWWWFSKNRMVGL